MQILRFALQCPDHERLKPFYTEVLGFPLADATHAGFAVQCGASRLEFHDGPAACHHFAFNIPPDQIASAAAWIEGLGIPLQPLEQQRIVQFPNWNAESVYFYDPAGNILELIARHRLPSSGYSTFSIDQVLNISEIGFATFTQAEQRRQLTEEVGLPVFGNFTPTFSALGDDHGLFILVDGNHKKWIPNMEPALPVWFETEIQQGTTKWHLHWDRQNLNFRKILPWK